MENNESTVGAGGPLAEPGRVSMPNGSPEMSPAPTTLTKMKSVRQSRPDPHDPYLIRGIAYPKSPWQWFLRRIYLEDKLELFREFCHKVDPDSLQDYQKVAWGVARQQFGFKSQAGERSRCEELEASRDEKVRERANIIWDQEAERNGVMAPVFGSGRESSYLQDVKWAFEHWPTYVRRRGTREWVLAREQELIKNAPSQGAYGLILFAQEDLKKFQDLCRGVLMKTEVSAEKQDEEIEVDRSLEKLREVVRGFSS